MLHQQPHTLALQPSSPRAEVKEMACPEGKVLQSLDMLNASGMHMSDSFHGKLTVQDSRCVPLLPLGHSFAMFRQEQS